MRKGDPADVGIPQATLPSSSIDASAPARLVRGSASGSTCASRGSTTWSPSPEAPFGGGQRWIAYFKNGVYVEGDERGKVMRRIS